MDEQQIRDEIAAAREARFANLEAAQKKKELYENFYRSINEELLLSVICPSGEEELHIQNILSATAAAETLEAELTSLDPSWSRPDGAILRVAPSFTPELAGIVKDRQKLVAEGMAPLGSYFTFQSSSDSESSTASSAFKQKVRLSCSVSIPGEYKLEWYYEWSRTGSSNNFEARLQKNDAEAIMTHTEDSRSSDLSQLMPIHGFKVVDLTVGTHTLDLYYRNTGRGSARIRNARLFLSKLL